MNEQSKIEENKKIITLLHKYFNNREWEKLRGLFHDDLRIDPSKIIPDVDGYYQQRREYSKRFMLAIFDPKTREIMKGRFQAMREKITNSPIDGMIENMIYVSEKENIQYNLIKLIAGGNEVWVKTRESGIGTYESAPYDYEVETIYELKDGKIIDLHRSSDYFVFFMQLGGLRARTEIKEHLVDYLNSLKDMGLIPDNVGITD